MRLYRCTYGYNSQGGGACALTFHVAAHSDTPSWVPGGDPDPGPQDVFDEIDTHLTTKFRAMLAVVDGNPELKVEDAWDPLNPDSPREMYGAIINSPGTRTVTNQDVPTPEAAIVALRTDKIGRSFRGRFWAPPVYDESQITAKTWLTTGSYYLAVKAFADELGKSFGGGSSWSTLWQDTWHAKVVVYSRIRRARDLSPFVEPVTSASVRSEPHWLRRRAH